MDCDAGAPGWPPTIDLTRPCWTDYHELLARLRGPTFPRPGALDRLLPGGTRSALGHPIRFVDGTGLDDTPYELRILTSGRVSTRPDNWHDLFNALAWARLPAIKCAMNALHCQPHADAMRGRRGRVRDQLTLFDECGLIVASPERGLLEALAGHRWSDAFQAARAVCEQRAMVVVAGHALLEKCLRPYKAMTAHALLIEVGETFLSQTRARRLAALDGRIAAGMTGGGLLHHAGALSPLPMMGLPGWWTGGPQDAAFYSDRQVFRRLRAGRAPALVHDFRPGL